MWTSKSLHVATNKHQLARTKTLLTKKQKEKCHNCWLKKSIFALLLDRTWKNFDVLQKLESWVEVCVPSMQTSVKLPDFYFRYSARYDSKISHFTNFVVLFPAVSIQFLCLANIIYCWKPWTEGSLKQLLEHCENGNIVG